MPFLIPNQVRILPPSRLLTVTASFEVVPEWRKVETPAGDKSTRLTQFPLFMVGGPLRSTLLGLGISMGSYTSRDFQLVTTHSEDIRGVPVDVTDTLTSRGGMNDIRLARVICWDPSSMSARRFMSSPASID